MGLVTPFLASLKPRRFIVSEVEVVESVGDLSRLATQGLNLLFLMLACVAVLRHLSKVDKKAEQGRVRMFWLLTTLLAAMPTISSFISGSTLQWGILWTISIYSATYFLPAPPLDWWIREARVMLLLIFVYGSLAAAILFPEWAWNQDYASKSTSAIFFMRLFGTANHSNALAPLSVFAWMLGRFPNCRLPGEYLHSMAILLIILLAQSKTIWLIVMLLLGAYSLAKIASLGTAKKYLAYFTIGVTFFFGAVYLMKYSPYTTRIENMLFDPQVLTLTGRLPLWLFAVDMWLEHPWLGQGLDAWSSEALLDYVRMFGWAAPHAHNQVLQILSQAGLLGLSVMALWAFNYLRIVREAPVGLRIPLWWLSVFFFLCGFTEVVLQYNIGPGHTILTWILFASVLIAGRSQFGSNSGVVLSDRGNI